MKFMEFVGWIAVVILAIAGVLWGETVVYGWGATSRDQEVAALQLELGRLNAYATALVQKLPEGTPASALVCEVQERGRPPKFFSVTSRQACIQINGSSILTFDVKTERVGSDTTLMIIHKP